MIDLPNQQYDVATTALLGFLDIDVSLSIAQYLLGLAAILIICVIAQLFCQIKDRYSKKK